jgi:hypothetical protein
MLKLVGQQSAPNDDPLRRMLVERRPPLTWRGIAGWLALSAIGLLLGLTKVSGLPEYIGLGLFLLGGFQVLRGMLRKAWLRVGGTDQPIKTYFEKRFEE